MKVILYTTLGCHLCDEALALLGQLQSSQEIDLQIDEVEIIDSEVLTSKYGIRIPVIVKVDMPAIELGWPFDIEALSRFLKA